jgi:hypothetical protein
LLGGFPLKFVIKDSADVTIRTVDNISGVNDTSSTASEWTSSGFTPTYISATQFSVVGDQTSIFQVNRRVRTTNTGGLIYGRITVSSFSAGITTVTVLNDTGSMDSGLSAVAYGFLSFTPSSVPFGLYASAGANTDITSLSGANALLINNATTSKPIVRQTVLSGPVDTNGLSSFGGSTGSTTVTATGTLIATAANGYALGGALDYTGSITNPSWTSLSTNGTMYLYLDIAAAGTCTTGSTTLEPTYRWGGADVTTNNQFTFNIQDMVGKVGNGSVATQTYRVFVGQVTVAGGVTTAITWYALQGRYFAPTGTNPNNTNTAVSFNHNIGTSIVNVKQQWVCNTIDAGYAVGDAIDSIVNGSGVPSWAGTSARLTAGYIASIGLLNIVHKSTSAITTMTLARWDYRPIVTRAF